MHPLESKRNLDTQEPSHGELTPIESRPFIGRAPTADFEQQRILGNVLSNMFGTRRHLDINGRYRVLERLGAGGMGEVYLCEDLELGRQVAVKRVRGHGTPRDERRLQREARAQACLSHPNVVQIYDTGTHEDCTFLTMEYVEGQTLSAWLAERRRAPQAILAHFIAAGRGLAAAHQAGLVHRDFKPDNVLIGADGVVRVADFGLAIAAPEDDAALEAPEGARASLLSRNSTVVGALRGTIRYMSLEALEGSEVDARSDQFSFCVALYEALWDEAPFRLDSVAARRLALETDAPGATKSLERVAKIVRRGLARDPEDRWPDMGALLDALEQLPRRRRRRIVASFAVAAVLASGLGAAQLMRANACAASAEAVYAVWNTTRRGELERRFEGFVVSHAVDSWVRVAGELERWARDWAKHSDALCEARLPWRADEAALEARASCLAGALDEFSEFVDTLADADDEGLAQAVVDVYQLSSPSSCMAVSDHEGNEDPGVQALRAWEEGEAAANVGDEKGAEIAFRRAVKLAEESKDPDLPIYLETLAKHVGKREKRALVEKGMELARERYGPKHPRTANRAYNYGIILHNAKEGGQKYLGLAAEIWEEGHEEPHLDLGRAYRILGQLALESKENERALELGLKALEIYEQVCEPEDPLLGQPHQLLAKVGSMRYDADAAIHHASEAAKAFERSPDDDRKQQALEMRLLLANQLMGRGQFEQARAKLDDVLTKGPDPKLEVRGRLLSAELSVRMNQLEQAEMMLRELALLHAHLGDRLDDYDVLRAVVSLRRGRGDTLGPERARDIAEPIGVKVFGTWLEELGISEAQQIALGYPRPEQG